MHEMLGNAFLCDTYLITMPTSFERVEAMNYPLYTNKFSLCEFVWSMILILYVKSDSKQALKKCYINGLDESYAKNVDP